MTDGQELYEEIKKELLPFESWERLVGESGAAYAAFCAYRDYGPERNIRRAVEGQFRKAELPVGFSPPAKTPRANLDTLVIRKYRMWRNWSMQFKWVKRAEDYDLYLDKLKQAEMRKTIEEQGKVHRMVTGKMLQVVNKKLDLMEPGELTQGNVTEWVETAVRTEREIAGLASPKENRNGQAGKQPEIQFTPDFEGL